MSLLLLFRPCPCPLRAEAGMAAVSDQSIGLGMLLGRRTSLYRDLVAPMVRLLLLSSQTRLRTTSAMHQELFCEMGLSFSTIITRKSEEVLFLSRCCWRAPFWTKPLGCCGDPKDKDELPGLFLLLPPLWLLLSLIPFLFTVLQTQEP